MKLKKTQKSVTEEVIQSIMSTKNMNIDALKEENLKLQKKVKRLEEQLLEIDQNSNHLDQYNRRNSLDNQGIPANVTFLVALVLK